MMLDYAKSYGASELGKDFFQWLNGQAGEIERINKLIEQRSDADTSP